MLILRQMIHMDTIPLPKLAKVQINFWIFLSSLASSPLFPKLSLFLGSHYHSFPSLSNSLLSCLFLKINPHNLSNRYQSERRSVNKNTFLFSCIKAQSSVFFVSMWLKLELIECDNALICRTFWPSVTSWWRTTALTRDSYQRSLGCPIFSSIFTELG